ncbi:MAG: nucleoside hydrolase [Clostridiales bacterium]|nr:nucleoside hydrolase [Clostridiales bacterium]
MSEKRKIIIDCDPGHDDAVAIMLAARNPKIELLGITTVHGNQTIDKVTRNALNVCQCLNIDVPVCKGLTRPLVRTAPPVEERVHGDSGLNGPVFAPLTKELDPRHAVDFIIETVMNADAPVTIVPTGPLSNVGMAIRKEPKILDNIEEIVLMGGAYQHGNVTPAAEYNIYVDPEAAHIVFSCGRPVVMMGLDLTRQALCYPEIVERMSKINTTAGKLFTDLMRFFCMTQKKVFGWEGGPLHDPTTVAYLIDPSCIETKEMYTEIDITGGSSYGRTNCDYFNIFPEKEKNTKVAVKLDVEKFWNIVEENLKLYDAL